MSNHILDIINHSFAGKPAEVETSFRAAIQDKMVAAIDARRAELASDMSSADNADQEETEED